MSDVGKGEVSVFFRHSRVIDDLEQQVAELIAQRPEVPIGNRAGDLVGFLDGVRGNGGVGLLEIPRAAAIRCAQPGHDFEKTVDGG